MTTEEAAIEGEKVNNQQASKRLHNIMEAASELTKNDNNDAEENKNKNEEESSSERTPTTEIKDEESSMQKEKELKEEKKGGDEFELKQPSKRYIPDHKKPDAALTFPEKLMQMMIYVDDQGKDDEKYCIAWLPEGKSFVVRNPDEFTRSILPKYFKATKFSSFTRKLYRWGFRQLNRGIGPDDPIIFGNECFQRDNAELMAKMRSITAAGTRKQQNMGHHAISDEDRKRLAFYDNVAGFGDANNKRPAGMAGMPYEQQEQRKRMLLDKLFQEKRALGSALADSGAPMYPPNQMGSGGMPTMNFGPPGGMFNAAGGSLGFQSIMNKHRNGGFNPFAQTGPSGSLLQASSTNPMGMFNQQHGVNGGGNNNVSGNGGAGGGHGTIGSGAGTTPTSGNVTGVVSADGTGDIVNAAINALRYSN